MSRDTVVARFLLIQIFISLSKKYRPHCNGFPLFCGYFVPNAGTQAGLSRGKI